jgi:hypothetical protein
MPLRILLLITASLLVAVPLALLPIGCSGSPTEADGTVTITQTTTTTVIPRLSAGTIVTSPSGTGLASATLMTFSAQPSGGVPPYVLSWNFGDGMAGAGPSPSHQYAAGGNFSAMVTVTDTAGMSAQTSTPVSIRTATGRWVASYGGAALQPEEIDLVQNQTAVTATINTIGDGLGSGSGSVANPRALSITVTFANSVPTPYSVTYIGALDDSVQTWSGVVTGYAACPCNFTATRSAPPGVFSSPVLRRQ